MTATKPASTKLDAGMQKRLAKAIKSTGLKSSDLLRIGLRRLLDEFEATGKIELGKEGAQ